MKLAVRGVPTSPMFDPSGAVAYSLIAAGFAVSLIVVAIFDFRLSYLAIAGLWSWPFIAFAGMLARRIGLNRVALLLEGVALLYGQGICLLLVLYGMAAISGPYVDGTLAAWDAALGFHWPTYAEATAPFAKPLTVAYRSFGWQPFLIVIALVWSGQPRRMWTLIVASILASVLTTIAFPFFPAEGVYNHFGYTPPGFDVRQTYQFTSSLDYFRGGGRLIEPSNMTGLVSFPSYHTAEAILFAWAGWTVRWLRWPMIALNAVVLASVPVIGAHYFIDVVAGAAVAGVAVVLAGWLDRRFTRPA